MGDAVRTSKETQLRATVALEARGRVKVATVLAIQDHTWEQAARDDGFGPAVHGGRSSTTRGHRGAAWAGGCVSQGPPRMFAIVGYGGGNLRSVERALLRVGAEPGLTGDGDELEAADGLVLPGVGAFAPALQKLTDSGIGRRVVDLAKRGNPALGVCLAYQLLFEESMEHGRHQGLVRLDARGVNARA